MISRISGKVAGRKDGALFINTGNICYEVMVPGAVMNALEKVLFGNDEVALVTYHYYQTDQSRSIPILIGFQNEIEKEFFEKFISVSGVGPKAACKALTEPFSATAGAIDRGDVNFLKKLPGIGDQKARLIVAKLQGKVGKYGLIQDKFTSPSVEHGDIRREALLVLAQLGYKRSEAEDMAAKAFERNKDVNTVEELLNEVYRERAVRD